MDSVGNPLKSDISDESEDECVQEPSRNKNICILEIDDVEDLEIINLILEPSPPEGYHVVNTQTLPGFSGDLEIARNLQMFTQVLHQSSYLFMIIKTHKFMVFFLLRSGEPSSQPVKKLPRSRNIFFDCCKQSFLNYVR